MVIPSWWSGLTLCLTGLAVAQPSARTEPPLSTYRMQVTLDPSRRVVTGTQHITWRNTTAQPIDRLRLHLYLNAFRDPRSTFMVEAGEEFRSLWRPDEYGGIEVTRLAIGDGADRRDLTAQMRFVHPDDDNEHDATVVEVPLPNAVPAGGEIDLHTDFVSTLPKAYRRTGWVPGDGFYCMQWFPKLGVLTERDGEAAWNCHQFHANTEFFADFSRYDVEITVPEGYVVGASGVEQKDRERIDGGRRTVAYVAEPVHDFAWVADPHFVRHEDTFGPVHAADDPTAVAVARQLGVSPDAFDLPRTRIELLLRPEHDTDEQVRRHLEAVKVGLRFYGLRYGPYPYPVVTAVDPGRDVQGHRLGGGMEYPTLFTCGTDLFPHDRQPTPESVTVHEFGHQYWYGLSANDEFAESWLDEGLNTYSEGRAQWLAYHDTMRPVRTTDFGLLTLAGVAGPFAPTLAERTPGLVLAALPAPLRSRLGELHFSGDWLPDSPLLELLRTQPTATYAREAAFSDDWNDRAHLLAIDDPDALVKNGWLYLDRASYLANSYYRPATLLRTLERIVGRDRWWAFLRAFHTRARFHHPTTADFVEELAAHCGSDVAAWFDAARDADAHLDYGIDSVEPADGEGSVKEVVVRRYGSLPADVDVRFRFAGRDAPLVRHIAAYDLEPWQRFRFTDVEGEPPLGRLLEVWVDPPSGAGAAPEHPSWPVGRYLLDENLLNNAWRAEPDHGPALYRGIRLLLQTQSRLSFAGWIG